MTKVKKKPEKMMEADRAAFACKFCGETKPLDEMRVVSRFFPTMVCCRDCEQKLR